MSIARKRDAPRPARDERLGRRWRLRRRGEFLRCYRQGRRRHGRYATLHVHPSGDGGARLGITASRKVGNAVARHRAKRWVREIFRRWPERSELPAVDVVVHLKPTVEEASFASFAAELRRQLSGLIPRRT